MTKLAHDAAGLLRCLFRVLQDERDAGNSAVDKLQLLALFDFDGRLHGSGLALGPECDRERLETLIRNHFNEDLAAVAQQPAPAAIEC